MEKILFSNGVTCSVNAFYGLSVASTIAKSYFIVVEQYFDIKLQVGANSGRQCIKLWHQKIQRCKV